MAIDELDKVLNQREKYGANEAPITPHQIVEDNDTSTIATSDGSIDDSIETTSLQSSETDASHSLYPDDDSLKSGLTLDEVAKQFVCGLTEDQSLWMRYHCKLKHLPNAYMRKLARNSIIPKKLEKVKPPVCVACLNGKQHKTPWRGRGKNVMPI